MSLASGRRARAAASTLSLLAALVACSPALRLARGAARGQRRDRAVPLPPGQARAHGAHRRRRPADAAALLRCGRRDLLARRRRRRRADPGRAAAGGAEGERRRQLGGTAPRPSRSRRPGRRRTRRARCSMCTGRLPDGRPVAAHAAFFVHGVRVYQATAIGEALPEDAVRQLLRRDQAHAVSVYRRGTRASLRKQLPIMRAPCPDS